VIGSGRIRYVKIQIITADIRGSNSNDFLLDVQQASAGWPWYAVNPPVVRVVSVLLPFCLPVLDLVWYGTQGKNSKGFAAQIAQPFYVPDVNGDTSFLWEDRVTF